MSALTVEQFTISGLAARGTGDPEHRRLLLLHGGAGSADHWTRFEQCVPYRLGTVAVDLPGHGESGGTLPVPFTQVVGQLRAVVQEMGHAVTVVAHSWGGLLALGLAHAYPASVRQLVLVGTAARLGIHPDLIAQIHQGRANREFFTGCFSPWADPEVIDLVVRDVARTRASQAALDLFDVATTDLTSVVAAIEVPSLVVIARGDRVISPRRSRELAQALPHSQCATVEAGHYLHLERPFEVAQMTTRFVDQGMSLSTTHTTIQTGTSTCPQQ